MYRALTTVSLISLVACGGAPKPIPPDLTPPSITLWDRRDPQAPVLPPGARRVQLIVTSADTEEHRLVWVVANGEQVTTVFRVDAGQLLEATAQALKDKQLQGGVTLTIGDTSLGSPLSPGPRSGEGPVGLPPKALVLQAARDLSSARL